MENAGVARIIKFFWFQIFSSLKYAVKGTLNLTLIAYTLPISNCVKS